MPFAFWENRLLWLGVLGLLWNALFLWLYLWSPGKGSVWYKGGATLGSVLIAAIGVAHKGGESWILLAAAFLCLAADVWIQHSLIPGVLVFLAAHIGFILWNCVQGGILWLGFLLGIVGCVICLWAYRTYISSFREKAVPLAVYVFVLLSMWGTALSLLWTLRGSSAFLAFLGATFFLASDMILGNTIATGRTSATRDRWVMCLYEPAILLLSLNAFFG